MDVKYNLPRSKGGTSLKDLGYEDFDPAETYAAGDVAIYVGKLYKFTAAHEGAWDDEDAEPTSVAQEAAPASTALQPTDIVDNLESLASDKPISARAVNEDMVNYVDQSITDTMRYIDQQDNSEHAGRVAGDNILDGKINGLSKLVNADGTIEEFDATKRYSAGSYCIKDGYVYRFTEAHEIGTWSGNDAVQTSVFDELESFMAGNNETIYIQLQSSDGELDVEGLQVSVAFEDDSPTQTLTADEDGKCDISIEKNKVVTLSVADQLGYQHVPSMTLRTNVNARYVFFTYEKEISSETCTVQVELVPSGGRPENYSELVGKTVNLIFSDGTARSAVTDSNRIATFLNVTKGLEGRTANPKCNGYVTPASKNFSTNFDTVGVTLTYSAVTVAGIFMVNQDGDDVTYEAWDTDDTLVALHFATEALVEAGCDYYVPVEELVAGWNQGHAFATSAVVFPNVRGYDASSPYYNGQEETTNIISDAATLEVQAPAAEYAVEQTFTIHGNTAHGYIGTRDQIGIIVQNLEMLSRMLLLDGKRLILGYYIWATSQYGTNQWHLREEGWSNLAKTYAFNVLPFFTF